MGSSPRVRGRPAVPVLHRLEAGLIPAGAGQTFNGSPPTPEAGAHPRGCGADAVARENRLSTEGSSPRVRGRLTTRPALRECRGLIPAGAGQTILPQVLRRAMRAHPRGCGADWRLGTIMLIARGSSPRVRGRLVPRVLDEAALGLIPAGAGQTRHNHRRPRMAGAHPRGCGADPSSATRSPLTLGSSPRVRGRRDRRDARTEDVGLIPAGAGQTRVRFLGRQAQGAHPRGCGADTEWVGGLFRNPGSSPRVRGRPKGTGPENYRFGLIPAGAGQTYALARRGARQTAHPRGCGADPRPCPEGGTSEGSSPRVRGRPIFRPRAEADAGLIPAGAGQTADKPMRVPGRGAHPRGCGADACRPLAGQALTGSSPRVRGRRVLQGTRRLLPGLIPAGAGQTPVHRRALQRGTGSSPRVRGRH